MPYITDANKELTLQMYANPMLLQDKVLSLFEEHVFDKRQVLDGNNVFTFGLEMEATMIASIVNEMTGAFESLYPERAKTMNDLYRHMSDYDFVGVFATPASTTVGLMLDRDWVVENAVSLNDGSGSCMIRIPSYSKFNLGEYQFGIYYPINIEVRKKYTDTGYLDLDNTLIHCQWDDSIKNPLHTLTTNIIEHRITRTRTTTYLCLEIPIFQFVNNVIKSDLVSSTGFLQRYDYPDEFYAARVFHWLNNSWHELPVTLSDVVYNQDVATAKVKVLTDLAQIEVSIPQVYFSSGMIGNKLMVMLYTTKGGMTVDLRGYSQDQYSASFLVNDDVLDPTYSEMLKRIPTVVLTPISTSISGGTHQSVITAIKNRIVNSAGSDDVLVTNAQIAEYLRELGFDCTKYIDNITDRIWMAKREITDSLGNTVASALYKTLLTADVFSNVDKYDSVVGLKDGINYMLMPNSIFKWDRDSDSMILLNANDKKALLNMPTDNRLSELNNNTYMVTPYHVRISTSDKLPMATAYNLFSPKIDRVTFIKDNSFTSTQVSIYGMNIQHLDNGTGGYKINIILYKTNDLYNVVPATASPKLTRNITAILRVKNQTGVYCFIEGRYAGKNDSDQDILSFTIGTDYDIDESGYIGSESLSLVSQAAALENNYNKIPLSGSWDVLFFINKKHIPDTEAYNVTVPGIPKKITDQDMVFVAQQSAEITFGKTIAALRNNIFVTAKGHTYQTYNTTIFAKYGSNVYRRWTSSNSSYDEQEIPAGETIDIVDEKEYCKGLEVITKTVMEDDIPVEKKYVKVPFNYGDIWYNYFTLEMELEHKEGDLLLSNSSGDESLKTPAMDIITITPDGSKTEEILYQDSNTNAAEPSANAKFVPYYLYGNKEKQYTGKSTIEVVDYLGLAIDYVYERITDRPYTTPSDITRKFIKEGESYYFEPIKDSFVYVEKASSDTESVPSYKIVIDADSLKSENPSYKLKLLKFTEDTSVTDLVDDYYSEKDEEGNIVRNQIANSEYGCLYVLDIDALRYEYNNDITGDALYNFYSDYDQTHVVDATLLSKYNITSESAKNLLKLRYPWKKICYAGHFWCIRDYHRRRSLMNFNSTLRINRYVGLAAIGHLQNLISDPAGIRKFDDLVYALKHLNEIENREEYVWVENYDPKADLYYSDNNLDINGEFTPLINIGDVKHGALLLNDLNNQNKHFVVVTGDSLEECFNAVRSINSRSGSCYLLTTYKDPSVENPVVTSQYFSPINSDIDISKNTDFDVKNWPWEMDNWIPADGTVSIFTSKTMYLDLENSYAKVVHKKGDVLLDATGRPIVSANESGRGLNYTIELIMYDYKPLQQSSKLADTYNTFVRDLISGYCDTVISMRSRMLERTRVYYSPIRTFGLGDFKSPNGDTFTHDLEISLKFKLHVPVSVVRDNAQKAIIRNNILTIVKNHLRTGKFNLVDVANEIKESMSDNIYYIDIDGVDGDDTVQTLISANKDICRPYLKQMLVRDTNNAVIIEDALTLEYASLI